MMIKKMFALFLLVVMLTMMTTVGVFAAQTVNVGDLIGDTKNWKGSDNAKFEIKDGILNIAGVDNSAMGYVGKKYKDEVFSMIANINLDAEGHWPTFTLRSSNPAAEIFGENNTYLVVVKNNQIEIQKWLSGAQVFMEVFPSEVFKSKKDTNLQLSAVNVDKGVKITVAVDGKTCAEYTDTSDPIEDAGYFGVIAWASASLSVKGAASAEATTDSGNNANPKTGDASLAMYIIGSGAALIGLVAAKKVRKR